MPTTLAGVYRGSLLRDLPSDLLGSVMPFFRLVDVAHLHEASKSTKKDVVYVRGRWTHLVVDQHDLDTWCRIEDAKQLNEMVSLVHITSMELHDLEDKSNFWTHINQWTTACPNVRNVVFRGCRNAIDAKAVQWPKLQSLTVVSHWSAQVWTTNSDVWACLVETKTLTALRLARVRGSTQRWTDLTVTHASTLGARLRELGINRTMSRQDWITLIRVCPKLTRLVIQSVGRLQQDIDDALFAEIGKSWPNMQHFSWTDTREDGSAQNSSAWDKWTYKGLAALGDWKELRVLCIRGFEEIGLRDAVTGEQMVELLGRAWPKLERLELPIVDIPTNDKVLAALPVTIQKVVWTSDQCTVTVAGLAAFLRAHTSLTTFPTKMLANMVMKRRIWESKEHYNWNDIFKVLQSDAMMRSVIWPEPVIDGKLVAGLVRHCPRLEELHVRVEHLTARCFEDTADLRPRPLRRLHIDAASLLDLDIVLKQIALLFPRLTWLQLGDADVNNQDELVDPTNLTLAGIESFMAAMPQQADASSCTVADSGLVVWLSTARDQEDEMSEEEEAEGEDPDVLALGTT
jgi:hypothetical protein